MEGGLSKRHYGMCISIRVTVTLTKRIDSNYITSCIIDLIGHFYKEDGLNLRL